MTVPTTLLDELADGAAALRVLALQERRRGGSEVVAAGRDKRAAAMDARVARIRELIDLAHRQKFNGGRRELARALTGPLPSPPATGNGETQKP